MDDAVLSTWHSLEGDEAAVRLSAAAGALQDGPATMPTCPSCGQARLRFFFLRFPDKWTRQMNRGGFWMWCPACRRYWHASGRVPSWWRDVPDITAKGLRPEPEALGRDVPLAPKRRVSAKGRPRGQGLLGP